VLAGSFRDKTMENDRKCDHDGDPGDEHHGAVPEEGESLFFGLGGNPV